MIDTLAKDVMIPISRYVTVKKTDTLLHMIQALDDARKSEKDHAHRDAIVVDEDGGFLGKVTMLDIFKALEPNYKKVDEKSSTGVLTQLFVAKAVEDFNLWMEPIKDVCTRGAHKFVGDVMHVPGDTDFIREEDSIELALHKYVMGVHQPLIVKEGDAVTGILRFGDVFEVTRKAMLSCPIN
ncbi:MAG: CBS domain-containing protein [Thermodesulfobacteriota bacterium]